MGNRRFGRRPPAPPPISRFKSIPHRWLSCPNNGHPIHIDSRPNLFFIPMKTPLIESIASLNPISLWTPKKAVSKAQGLVAAATSSSTTTTSSSSSCAATTDTSAASKDKKNLCFLSVNVSQHHEMVTENDWKMCNASYARCTVPKDYDPSSIDNFCEIINTEIEKVGEDKILVCLVYCGCGLNRVGFSIASYLTRHCGISLPESLKMLDESSPRLIYRQKPLDVLSSVFQTTPQIHGPAPDWVRLDEKVGPIGEIPLPLEKFNAIKKLSKRQATQEERREVLVLLSEATNDQTVLANDGAFPTFTTTVWDNKSFNLLRTKPYLMTFEPRGVKIFVVVNSEGRAFIVDPTVSVWEMKAKAHCEFPAVASAYLVEEKRRAVILTTDLFILGHVKVADLPLAERLAHLSHSFTSRMKADPYGSSIIDHNHNHQFQSQNNLQQSQNNIQQSQNNLQQSQMQYMLQFVFRPMARLSNASRLRKDLASLFVKCDGISFFECDAGANPLKSIFLPINPTVILQFDYNGNDKAILYARGEEALLEPVGVYIAKSPKYNGFDGRTNRFEFDRDKHEWAPVAVGHNDPPATTEEVSALLSFLMTNISYDNIFSELDKIVTKIN